MFEYLLAKLEKLTLVIRDTGGCRHNGGRSGIKGPLPQYDTGGVRGVFSLQASMIVERRQPLGQLYVRSWMVFIYSCIYIYVSVNLCNQAIRELTENFRQFVKFLFQSVNLFSYAFKTLKPDFFWYAVDTNLFRIGSTNPKKKSQTLNALWWGEKPPIK